MSRHNPVLAVAFSMFLIVLFFVLSPIGNSFAEDDVKDPNPPQDTGPGVSTKAVGGPDAFGYKFTDSTELMGPIYNFIDISATGTPAAFTSGDSDDGGTDPLPLGFNFNFYGINYSQIAMSTNGYLNFNLAGDLLDFGNDCPGLNVFDPQNSIYVLWDDLDFSEGGGVYYQHFPLCPNTSGGEGPCIIFQWDNADFFPADGVNPFDIQAILYDNGNIMMQYASGNPQMGSGSTTGIENAPPDIGLDYNCNTSNSIPDNHAVCFIHPDSPNQTCDPTPFDLVDVNSGVCVFTKSNLNQIHIQGATPNKKVALIMGKKPGSFIIGGNVCNGTQLDMSQPRIFGIYNADSNGEVWVQAPVPPSGNLGKAQFQLIDVATCTTNEVKPYFLVPDELPDPDFDGDGIVNCDDECPTEGPPGMGEELGPDGCIVLPCDDIIQGDPANDCPCDYFSVPMTEACWTPLTDPNFNPCDNGNCMTLDQDLCEIKTQGFGDMFVGIEAVAIPGEFFCQVYDFGIDGCPADSNMTIEALTETQFRACLCRIEQYADTMELNTGIDITGGDSPFSCSTCDDVECAVGEVCVEGECVPEAICGNGLLDPGELCDDGNMDVGDGCNEDCTSIEDGYSCPIPGMPCTLCGNGIIDGTDVCDDGNLLGGDGCSADCTMVEDGFNCIIPGMQCAFCGNGTLEPGEECDDGNTIDGDGCSFDCLMIEPGFVCPIPNMPCDPLP